MWDMNVKMHYVFSVAEKISVYPLGGLGYAHATLHGDGWDDASDGKNCCEFGRWSRL